MLRSLGHDCAQPGDLLQIQGSPETLECCCRGAQLELGRLLIVGGEVGLGERSPGPSRLVGRIGLLPDAPRAA